MQSSDEKHLGFVPVFFVVDPQKKTVCFLRINYKKNGHEPKIFFVRTPHRRRLYIWYFSLTVTFIFTDTCCQSPAATPNLCQARPSDPCGGSVRPPRGERVDAWHPSTIEGWAGAPPSAVRVGWLCPSLFYTRLLKRDWGHGGQPNKSFSWSVIPATF